MSSADVPQVGWVRHSPNGQPRRSPGKRFYPRLVWKSPEKSLFSVSHVSGALSLPRLLVTSLYHCKGWPGLELLTDFFPEERPPENLF